MIWEELVTTSKLFGFHIPTSKKNVVVELTREQCTHIRYTHHNPGRLLPATLSHGHTRKCPWFRTESHPVPINQIPIPQCWWCNTSSACCRLGVRFATLHMNLPWHLHVHVCTWDLLTKTMSTNIYQKEESMRLTLRYNIISIETELNQQVHTTAYTALCETSPINLVRL